MNQGRMKRLLNWSLDQIAEKVGVVELYLVVCLPVIGFLFYTVAAGWKS